MEWTAAVAAGDWIRERLDERVSASMHGVVPRGFPAYARIFHPASRSKPVSESWPPLPHEEHTRAWDEFSARQPEIETVAAGWREAATGFGTTFHPLAQWSALVHARGADTHPSVWQQTQTPDGWQFDSPAEGKLDAQLLTAVAELLAAHTTTPDDGFVALWEGWGGVVGAMGWGPSRAYLTLGDQSQGAEAARHDKMLRRSARDVFNDVFRRPTWQPGVLPDDVSKGPRLELPDRSHVLFRGGIAEFRRPDWPQHVPWFDRELLVHGFPPSAESPSLIWPADHSWVLVSEVDFDSTIVAGSPELVADIIADPRLEAAPIPGNADLTWDGDMINR